MRVVDDPAVIRLMRSCAWCERLILDEEGVPDGDDVLVLGAEVASPDLRRILDHDPSPVLRLVLQGADRTVVALVSEPHSEARTDGNEITFLTCGEACCSALQAAVAQDTRIVRVWR